MTAYLQAHLGHSEVDQCGLRLQLWLVVRVRHLRVQVQLEAGVVLHLFVSKLDRLAFLDQLLA